MNKKKIRCFKKFANVAPKVFNHPVYVINYEGWSNFSLLTCINCGELFVIDFENPSTKNLTIKEIASSGTCPTCNHMLSDTLRNYPKTIKLPDGGLGSYIPETILLPDQESIIMEFFEIVPGIDLSLK